MFRRILPFVLVLLATLMVAPYTVDGQCSRTRIRKSLNQLNQAEWDALNRGILAMKSNGSMDRLTRLHRQGMQWHGTPHFFLMHRALMADFENELLRVAPTLTGVPYWDELREGAGILRSDVFTSARLSPIRAGPLQGVLRGLRDDSGQLVQRNPQNLSPGYTWLPPNEVMTRALERMANYGDFSRVVEVSPHNQFHVYVGGHMGNPSISPSDPAFWMHHAYIDLLWALWQSMRPQNRENLQAWGTTRPGIDPAAPVVLYNGRYTNLDMLRYRTRLCYQYTMPSTRQSRLARRSFEMTRNPSLPAIPPGEIVSINLPPQPQQPQPPAIRMPASTRYVTETFVVTEVDKETRVVTQTQLATQVTAEVVTENLTKEQPPTKTEQYEEDKPAATQVAEPQKPAVPTPFFKPMWEAPADLVYQVMPNMSLAEWRKVEDDLNTAIAELNAEIATGTMQATQLKTVEDLFFNSGMNCTKEVAQDDYRDSLIPEVQQLAANVVKQTDSNSAAAPVAAGKAVLSAFIACVLLAVGNAVGV